MIQRDEGTTQYHVSIQRGIQTLLVVKMRREARKQSYHGSLQQLFSFTFLGFRIVQYQY
jgi:hypothetical protein